MPRATIQVEPVRKELKNLEGGYVVLKPLTYGQSLHRRDMASKMTMEARRNRNAGDAQKMVIDTYQRASRHYEFANCIIEHNLEDENGTQLDFKSINTFDRLDPKVGEEIERYLDDLNSDLTATEDDSGVPEDESFPTQSGSA